MRYTYLPLAAILAWAGCAPLTKTQIKAVNSFAVVSKDFSAYPSKIMSGLADVRMSRGVYFANSLDSARLHQQELDSVFSFRQYDYSISEKFNITFRIIDKYAQSLVLLTSDKYQTDLQEQAQRFGTDLDSLTSIYNAKNFGPKVPTSIGGAVSQLIAFGGSQYVRRKQAQEVKKFVPQADALVEQMTKNLLEFLESGRIAALIENEEKGLTRDYLDFLRKSRTITQAFGRKDTVFMLSNTRSLVSDDLEYIKLKAAMVNIRALRAETIEATRDLRAAHAKLLEAIKEKRKLKTGIAEVQELYEGVRTLQKTIRNIEKYKSAVNESND